MNSLFLSPRILVFGYSDIGHACLNLLIHHNCHIIGLYTHEDNPQETIWFQSAALLAKRHSIPVFTPSSPNTPEEIEHIQNLKPDIISSFYYRHLICDKILNFPPLGAFNMHGSLLPQYRGRSVINWAVLLGATETGATLHHMTKHADRGDIVDQEAFPIGPQDKSIDTFHRMTTAACKILERQLKNLLEGKAPRRAQNESEASIFKGRKPEDGIIDWTKSATVLFNQIRSLTHPFPGSFTYHQGRKLMIWWAQPQVCASSSSLKPGEIINQNPFQVACSEGFLEIYEWSWQDTEDFTTPPDVGQVLGITK